MERVDRMGRCIFLANRGFRWVYIFFPLLVSGSVFYDNLPDD